MKYNFIDEFSYFLLRQCPNFFFWGGVESMFCFLLSKQLSQLRLRNTCGVMPKSRRDFFKRFLRATPPLPKNSSLVSNLSQTYIFLYETATLLSFNKFDQITVDENSKIDFHSVVSSFIHGQFR